MDVILIKYSAGNYRSVENALARLGITADISDDPERIRRADRVIFPGVGEARSAMESLRERGLDSTLTSLEQPVLGICIGMQLLCRSSEEGDASCLGVFPTSVKRFDETLKVPHVGWNSLSSLRGPLFEGIPESAYVYFVHSYYAELCDATSAEASYGLGFSAALSQRNFHGVQFHAEKSAEIGARIIDNFLKKTA